MTFGWEAEAKDKKKRAKIRRPEKVKTLADCRQGDVVLYEGREFRIAWFWLNQSIAILYPTVDRHLYRDCSNMLSLKLDAKVSAVKLVP